MLNADMDQAATDAVRHEEEAATNGDTGLTSWPGALKASQRSQPQHAFLDESHDGQSDHHMGYNPSEAQPELNHMVDSTVSDYSPAALAAPVEDRAATEKHAAQTASATDMLAVKMVSSPQQVKGIGTPREPFANSGTVESSEQPPEAIPDETLLTENDSQGRESHLSAQPLKPLEAYPDSSHVGSQLDSEQTAEHQPFLAAQDHHDSLSQSSAATCGAATTEAPVEQHCHSTEAPKAFSETGTDSQLEHTDAEDDQPAVKQIDTFQEAASTMGGMEMDEHTTSTPVPEGVKPHVRRKP